MHYPKYPIYIISKGRWDSRMTQRTMEELGVPYRIVIEESEYDKYAENVPKDKIITLPPGFRDNPLYAKKDEETGLIGGSIPVRNFVWEHSIAEGHKKHWVLDDNMRHIYRLHNNLKIRVKTGSAFRILEDFTDRYTNVKLSGMNYDFFCPAILKRPPYYVNTRIYSCILIDNSLPQRWRGKYNEDTDLSLRVLKDNWCTILFHQFLVGKQPSMTMKGGNTEEVYHIEKRGDRQSRQGDDKFDNRKEFAESLRAQHPDVVKVTWKWGRWHHDVNYSVFTQKLIKKEGLNIPKGFNEYGMKLVSLTPEQIAAEGEKNGSK